MGILYEHQFTNATIGKWDDQYIFINVSSNRGNRLYVNYENFTITSFVNKDCNEKEKHTIIINSRCW